LDCASVGRTRGHTQHCRADRSRDGAPGFEKNKVKPWQLKSWCNAEITPDFLARLKDILDLSARPPNPLRPTVCFDEQNVQLLADARCGLPLIPGNAQRQDYEYKRHGIRNLFIFVEPKAGRRHLLITRRRTKEDWAKAMRYLVDELYPDAPLIDLVYDNLNTHTIHTLIEIFGKAEADRILARLMLHPTPLHASWLNMAEIELSAMTRQCLDRRIPDEWTLALELIAWEQERNARHQTIHWSLDWKRANRLFKLRKHTAPCATQN